MIVFGSSVGRLVDTMGRISAARLSLAIQVTFLKPQLAQKVGPENRRKTVLKTNFTKVKTWFSCLQNLATASCALILAAFLHYRAELEPDGPGQPTLIVSVVAIVLAAVARLAS